MRYGELNCPECNGEGNTVCDCCGSANMCEACDGEGIDPEKVNMRAHLQACLKAFSGLIDGTWEVIEEKIWVGRTDGKVKVYYRDFLRK